MIIQATSHGTAAKEEPLVFTYSGNFTDNRDADGKGKVRLNTSGTLTITSGTATVIATVVGAGGGAVFNGMQKGQRGGNGGKQTVETILESGTYEIVIGTGGAAVNTSALSTDGGKGGDTTAFGYTSTGGTGGITRSPGQGGTYADGTDGVPNGDSGNGGLVVNKVAQPGGDGYVELTFS